MSCVVDITLGGSVGSGQANQVEEISFSVDLETGAVESLSGMTLESAGLRERDDLQRWVAERPEIVGPGLLVVTTEFDRWELRERRVLDRLDVLFLDTGGSLVVGELKRDWASDTRLSCRRSSTRPTAPT